MITSATSTGDCALTTKNKKYNKTMSGEKRAATAAVANLPLLVLTTNKNKTMSGKKRAATAAVANLALLDGTKRGRSSAWEWFESYQRDNDKNLLSDIQDSNAKGENVKDQLVGFANWLIANPLKKKYNNKSLIAESVGQYFGSVKELLKEKTSDLPIWVNHKSGVLHIRCEHGKLLVKNRDFLGMKDVDLVSIILSLIKNDANKNRTRPHFL
jgi:hypothetical protein